jgi:hypothetical protein
MTRATGRKILPEPIIEMRRLPVLELGQMDETLFAESWPARHNQEIWRAPEGGMYTNTRAPSLSAKAHR